MNRKISFSAKTVITVTGINDGQDGPSEEYYSKLLF